MRDRSKEIRAYKIIQLAFGKDREGKRLEVKKLNPLMAYEFSLSRKNNTVIYFIRVGRAHINDDGTLHHATSELVIRTSQFTKASDELARIKRIYAK